jgi:hypothetical protein
MPTDRRRAILVAFALGALVLVIGAGVRVLRVVEPLARPPSSHTLFTGNFHCAKVGSAAWSPLPGVEYTGRLAIQLPAATLGRMLLVIGDDVPLDVVVESPDGEAARVNREFLEVGRGASGPPPDYWLENGTPWDAPPEVQQLTLHAFPNGERNLSVRLGRRAPRVLARLSGYADAIKADVCAADLGVPDAFAPTHQSVTIEPSLSEYFGTGWSGVETDAEQGIYVRSMDEHAAILIPSATRSAMHVRLRARRGDAVRDDTAPSLVLRVNNIYELPSQPLRTGTADYDWDVPERVWVRGTNELLFSVTGVPRPKFLRAAEARAFELALLSLQVQRVP